MNETPPSSQVPAKLQANVDYLPGITITGAQSALLEWSADDRIKLFVMDTDGISAKEVLFDVSVSEIERVKGSFVMLTFVIQGKKYNTQFSQTAVATLGIGGAIGIAGAFKNTAASGINIWLDNLKEAGVDTGSVKDWNWVFKAALIGAGVCVGIAVIATVVIVSVNM